MFVGSTGKLFFKAGVTTQKWVVNRGVENCSNVSDVSKGKA